MKPIRLPRSNMGGQDLNLSTRGKLPQEACRISNLRDPQERSNAMLLGLLNSKRIA